jgi:hypothetical protein
MRFGLLAVARTGIGASQHRLAPKASNKATADIEPKCSMTIIGSLYRPDPSGVKRKTTRQGGGREAPAKTLAVAGARDPPSTHPTVCDGACGPHGVAA